MDDVTFDNSLSGAFAVVGDTTRYAEMNKGIQPLFFIESVEDGKATLEAGTLRMVDHEFVRLFTAGDVNSCPVHPVNAEIRERFAEAYAKWQATRSNDHITGTPLAAWPLAGRGFVMELKALHIRSVEDLASVADTNISRITDGRAWREKAKAWLEGNKDAAAAARYAAKAEQLETDNADLRKQLRDLADRLQVVETSREHSDDRPRRKPTPA
jgi:hypothetical protein